MALRINVLFAALALAGAAVAQQSKVTYTTTAVPVKRALAELSKQTGMNLQTTAGVENEILILRLNGAPIDEVMKHIASVTSSEWTKQGEIYYLGASLGARNRENAEAQKAFEAKLAKALKRLSDELTKKPDPKANPDPAEMGMRSPFGGGGGTSMNKLAIAIGAPALASVPPNGRVVFSTSPTNMQRRLPSSVNAIISEYVVQHNKIAASVKREEPAKNELPEEAAMFMKMFGADRKPQVITGPPAKALVVATRQGLLGYMLSLKLYDSNGKVLAGEALPLQVEMPFDPTEMMKPPSVDNNVKGQDIKLSPLAQELAGMGQSIGAMRGGNVKVSADLRARLQDPVTYDPLSYLQSEALIATAEAKNEMLVANLPDEVLSFFGNFGPKSKLTTDSFLKDISGEDKAKVEEADGWMIVRPANPVKSRGQRTNRPALKDLIATSVANGYASLDALAAYALKNPAPMTDAPASTTYVMMFVPGALQGGMMGLVDWNMLKLWGTFSSSQKQSFQTGGRIPFGQLAPNQQTLLAAMLYGPDSDLDVVAGNAKPEDSDPLMGMITKQISRFMPSNDADYRTEPTEIMPSGLPANGFITVNFSSEPAAVPTEMSTDLGMFSTLGPMELGLLKMFKDDPKLSQMGGAIPTIGSLRVGTRSIYEFSFFVAQDVKASQRLQDDHVGKDAQVYKMDSLPQDFQTRIDKMAEKFSKNGFWKLVGAMGGMGRQGVPPQN